MTRKEWMEKNLPKWINENADGGVIGCPRGYRELVRMDPSVLTDNPCKGCHALSSFHVCESCWNQELNVKEERKETMTRKEWMLENHPNQVFPMVRGGVIGCPGDYLDLADIDPSVAECSSIRCGMYSDCTTCWSTPLPEEGIHPSDKVEIRKTMGEPHIGDTFYTIIPIALGKYQLYIVGKFIVNLMSSINDRQVRCSAFDDQLAYQYTFFYDLVDKTISFNYEIQRQAKSTPNLDRSLFLERRDAIEALEKWTGNVVDKSYYFLKQKGE